MPRLARKVGHQTGEVSQMTSTSRRNTFSAKISHYDNNQSINSIKKEKYTLVRNPLRTKMSTMSNAQASKSFFMNQSIGTNGGANDPEAILADLKAAQKAK